MLKLMYITNRPGVACIAEAAGVDRIFVDLETIGKAQRQGGMNTVQSHHTVSDVSAIRSVIQKAELLVRVNPIHDQTEQYGSSMDEIDAVISAGADVIMLPYFKTADEVKTFVNCVDGRVKTMLLFETPEALEHMDEILEIKGIDEVFIGLNDLSLGYGKKFMFELLANGTVEKNCQKFKQKGYPYGFGGIASIGKGMLPSEYIIREHYKLGSTCVILSRSFCNVNQITEIDQISELFFRGIKEIRKLEKECQHHHISYFNENEKMMQKLVGKIVADMEMSCEQS